MKKVLVTGSSGFIGKEFIKIISRDRSSEIYQVSRTKHGTKGEYVGDLTDKDFVELISETRFDEIFHFAWQGLPVRNEEESNKNLTLSKNLVLALLKKSSHAQFNILGSCLEYGEHVGVISDNTKPQGKDPFASAKIELHSFMEDTGVRYRWLRPFYVYGKEQRQTSLIPHLIQSFSEGNPVKLNSYSNSHDFINVHDVATAIWIASKSDKFGPINIGTGVLTSVGEIVEKFSEHFQMGSQITHEKKLGLYSESGILRNELDWQPEFMGIEGMLKYYFDDSRIDGQ